MENELGLFGVGDGWIESIVVNGWWRGMA